MDLEQKLYNENIKVASFAKRVYAYSIDELLASLIIFGAFFNQFMAVAGNMMALISLTSSMFFYFFILKTAYHTIFIYMYGKTIGKMVARIRTIDIYTLDKPNLSTSFLRAVLRNFDEMFFYLGMLYALVNPFTQALHDKFSKVIVVND